MSNKTCIQNYLHDVIWPILISKARSDHFWPPIGETSEKVRHMFTSVFTGGQIELLIPKPVRTRYGDNFGYLFDILCSQCDRLTAKSRFWTQNAQFWLSIHYSLYKQLMNNLLIYSENIDVFLSGKSWVIDFGQNHKKLQPDQLEWFFFTGLRNFEFFFVFFCFCFF